MTSPAERPPWEAEFHRRTIAFLISKGQAVSLRESLYGWASYDRTLDNHIRACRPAYDRCTWQDHQWTEFAGTFADDNRCNGIEAVIYCSCGEIDGRHWRYEGSYADLISAITRNITRR